MRYRRAARAFEAFTGRKPSRVKATDLPDGNVIGWELGPAVGVAYEAVRDGERARYFHEFAKRDRPALVASEDGRKLFFAGGNYTVTDRGIEDMSKLFVVNPSPRRKPAMKRSASGRFVKGGSRRPRRRRAGSRQVAIFSSNPHRRRRRATSAKRRTYRRNPTARRFRRNPSLAGGMRQLPKLLIPAVGIGAGAVAAEMFMGYLPIPATWKSGVLRQVTKGAVGLAAGWALATFLKQKRLGLYVAAGAVVIAVHDAIKEAITAKLPAPGGAFGQYVLPLPSQFAGAGMGYVNPGRVARLGQYTRPLRSQFAGVAPIQHSGPGGETSYDF